METIYLTPRDFRAARTIQNYPNPVVKIGVYAGKTVRLEVAGCIQISPVLDQDQQHWYGYRAPEPVVLLTAQDGFFPTRLFCDVDSRGRYVSRDEFGLIVNTANLGTASELVEVAKLANVLTVLQQNHFSVLNP